MILAKDIRRFYKHKQHKYKRTTNLAKDIQRENSKDSLARGLLLYIALHEADTYNGLVGTCQTMGTPWSTGMRWVREPSKPHEVRRGFEVFEVSSQASKVYRRLQKHIVDFGGIL